MTTLEERVAEMPRLVPIRPAAACALAIALLLAAAAVAVAKGVPANLRVVDSAGEVLAEESLRAGTTKVPTSPAATCLGKGTGGSGRAVKVEGPTALGLLARAARSTSSLRPLSVTDHFLGEFGLGLCGVGGFPARGGYSWYLKVNHRNPEVGGDSVKLKAGDEVLWALARYPYPSELSLAAPERVAAGVPFAVRVFSYDDKGKRRPVAGVTVGGALAPTDSDGTATVVLAQPAELIARHGKEIPSNRVAVCVDGACPRG
jgi:hypothetical protein